MNNRKNCFRFRMMLLAVMGLCLAAALYAGGPAAEDYQDVYNDGDEPGGTVSVTPDAGSLTLGMELLTTTAPHKPSQKIFE